MKIIFDLINLIMSFGIVDTAYKAQYIQEDFALDANERKSVWTEMDTAFFIDTDWAGSKKYLNFKTDVKCCWSNNSLYFLFNAPYDKLQTDPEIIEDLNGDCWGIWKKDVVEVFIGGLNEKSDYFEFVVSPLGQKIDISHKLKWFGKHELKTEYSSGWSIAVKVDDNAKKWITEIKIPLKSIIIKQSGNTKMLRFNSFRCSGVDEKRLYLAMNPTKTKKPNFHVLSCFKKLELAK